MFNLRQRHFLIVEDEFFIADDLRTVITKAGGIVLGPASRLRDAKKLVAQSPVDFAILDINLFGDMSFEFADHLLDRNVTVVFATGYDPQSIPQRFADIPCWQKPYDVDEIVRWMATAILNADP
jgi:two-component SAPR family response regulator